MDKHEKASVLNFFLEDSNLVLDHYRIQTVPYKLCTYVELIRYKAVGFWYVPGYLLGKYQGTCQVRICTFKATLGLN